MNNIFENTYFGKPYKTRGGRRALYLGEIKEDTKPLKHILNIEGYGSIKDTSEFLNDGSAFGIDSQFDIISEYQLEVNEEELDKLAYTFANNNELLDSLHISDNADIDDLAIAYKAGFHSKS